MRIWGELTYLGIGLSGAYIASRLLGHLWAGFATFADELCADVYGDIPALPEEATARGTGGGRAEHERGPSLTRYKTSDIAHRREGF
jgi:hypothetical protein